MVLYKSGESSGKVASTRTIDREERKQEMRPNDWELHNEKHIELFLFIQAVHRKDGH